MKWLSKEDRQGERERQTDRERERDRRTERVIYLLLLTFQGGHVLASVTISIPQLVNFIYFFLYVKLPP